MPAFPAWTGPLEFSADYLWSCTRPAERFDRPARMVHVAVRQGRMVRAVGLDLFGATLFDLVVTAGPQPGPAVFRVGQDHPDARLAEPVLRAWFLGERPRGLRWLQAAPGTAAAPPEEGQFLVNDRRVAMRLSAGQAGPQPDQDFKFSGRP